jgi:hypothetical protein
MPAKRGWALSTPSDDPAVQRRREQTAARNRSYYERQQQARAALVQPTAEQEQQRDDVLERPFTPEDAAVTLAQLGLRVQNTTLT